MGNKTHHQKNHIDISNTLCTSHGDQSVPIDVICCRVRFSWNHEDSQRNETYLTRHKNKNKLIKGGRRRNQSDF